MNRGTFSKTHQGAGCQPAIWTILLLTALCTHAQPAPSTLPPEQLQRLGVFPAREDIVQTHGTSSIYLDHEGLHVAVVTHPGQKFVVYTDGQRGPAYDAVGALAISPAGGHIAYAAKKGAQWFLIFDGKETTPCDGVNEAWDYKPQYGPTGPYEGYSIGEPSPDAALCFSDDGKHFACAIQRGNKHSVIMDGQAGPEYDAVGELTVSSDGQHFAYLAKEGAMQFAIIDGKPGPAYSGVGPLVFSHDRVHSAYVALQAGKYFIVTDGQVGPPFDFIDLMSVNGTSFTTNGSHLTYTACLGSKRFTVLDGHALPQDGESPSFSADSRHLAYVAAVTNRNAARVVLDGQPGPLYPDIRGVQLSPDGQHVIFIVHAHGKFSLVFDGKPDPVYDLLSGLVVSPNGRRSAYEARIGVPGIDFHGHPITNDTEMAQPFIVVDGVSGPKYNGVYQLIFSPDSRHVAYEAAKGTNWLAVVDDREGVPYGRIWGLKFSADGGHLAYLAEKENGKNLRMVVVVDGHESNEYETVLTGDYWHEAPYFTANESLSYLAVRGGVLYHVTQPLTKTDK